MKRLCLPLLWLCLMAVSCKEKNEPAVDNTVVDPNANNILPDDPVPTQEQVRFLDSLQEATPEINMDSIVLPNGMKLGDFDAKFPNGRIAGNERTADNISGIQMRKNDIVRDMLSEAKRLFKRADFVKLDESTTEHPHRPAQPNGIAYGYGNKDYSVRKNPDGNCYEEVYGLDCSGFLSRCAAAAGVSIAAGTSSQGVAANWDAALHTNPKNKKLYVKDLGRIPAGELESGDIVVWGSHIGFIAGKGTEAYLCQSNGSAANGCTTQACIEQQQEKNRGTGRGPNLLSFTTASTGGGWFGSSYKVLRITTDISGTWTLRLRCAGESYDALEFDVEIPKENAADANSNIRNLKASGTGTDYDGTPLTVTLTGTYNKKTNIIEAEMGIGDDGEAVSRIDVFKVELNMDDTGYFATTRKLDNGGCGAETRLINNNTKKDGRISQVGHKSNSGSSLLIRR